MKSGIWGIVSNPLVETELIWIITYMQHVLKDHSWPYLPACLCHVLGISGGPTEWSWPYCEIFCFLWAGSFNTYRLPEIFFIYQSQIHLRIDLVLFIKLSRIFHRFYQVFWAGQITPEGFGEWDREGKSSSFCLTVGSFHISWCGKKLPPLSTTATKTNVG